MNENRFATLDFYLAAFLMASSCKLSDYYREKGFTTFVFTEDKKLITLVKEYYSEKTLIEPITHARAIKNLKSLIHSATISTSKPPSKNEFNKTSYRS